MIPEHALEFVADDFSVELWTQENASALFGAKRLDLWHFVRTDYQELSDNQMRNMISQRHISGYEIAKDAHALEQLWSINDVFQNAPSHESTFVNDNGLRIRPNGHFDISLMMTHEGLPQDRSELLKEDVACLEKAGTQIVEADGFFELPGARSFNDHPVAASSRSLIEAIAFEKELRGELDPHQFGIYSAFCTWRDFIVGNEASTNELTEHVEGQFEYDPDLISDEFCTMAMDVQERLLSRPIWGRGINVGVDEAIEILRAGMSSLTSIQRAQFNLMNGMHSAGLFLPLAVVVGTMDFVKYIEWQTAHYEPDSEDEQRIRADSCFIELLGRLAGSGPVG